MELPLTLLQVPVPPTAGKGLRILVLHQHYWPEVAATAQILSDLCEDLVSFGHRVTVVCGQPSYRVASGMTTRPTREVRKGVEIHRVWSYVPRRRTIPNRLLHYGSFFGTSLGASFVSERPDVCLVMSTPPLLLGLSGALLRSLRGVPFVYSVQDLYPDLAIKLGVLGEHGMSARAIGNIANVCYGAASAIVTLSDGMARKLEGKGVASDRIAVVPNWADTTAIQPCPRDNSFARAHDLAGRFVVQYSGNLGLSQGLESVLEAAVILKSEPITWLLVGDGNAKLQLESKVRDLSLSNVRFLPPQKREHLSELLGACDVGLVPMKRGVADDLVPSKLYGIMAAARPVLAAVDPCSEVARVVRSTQCGWLAEPEDPRAIAQRVREVFRSSEAERRAVGRRARAASSDYSRTAITKKYDRVLRAVATGSAGGLQNQ